ncbi:DUF397 domain-containing protein [Embleya sp. AB8]|uniref:DUF397 domain-containing protein n=1 Tax=Embleya sp. AB8 TaxID=3156304 RepID=UPI003C74CA26
MIRVPQVEFTGWRKSSYSNAYGGDCVEVAHDPTVVPVRDSKEPGIGHLVIPSASWSALVVTLRSV